MKYSSVSKSVTPGTLCALRGGKLIRCGKGMKPVGVWAGDMGQMYREPYGRLIDLSVPARLVVGGECRALAGLS